jgi:hypothetical protein
MGRAFVNMASLRDLAGLHYISSIPTHRTQIPLRALLRDGQDGLCVVWVGRDVWKVQLVLEPIMVSYARLDRLLCNICASFNVLPPSNVCVYLDSYACSYACSICESAQMDTRPRNLSLIMCVSSSN